MSANTSKEVNPLPIVCLVVEDIDSSGNKVILIQKRIKERRKTDYRGSWELPQGKIKTGETFIEAATRELQEETTLVLIGVNPTHKIESNHVLDTTIESLYPLICALDIHNGYLGIGLLIRAKGFSAKTSEASNHKWVDKEEVARLIEAGLFFPLDIPVLKKYFSIP